LGFFPAVHRSGRVRAKARFTIYRLAVNKL